MTNEYLLISWSEGYIQYYLRFNYIEMSHHPIEKSIFADFFLSVWIPPSPSPVHHLQCTFD